MSKWLVAGIVFVGFLFRVISINNYPVGFNADEASFGYDAYSILKTGRDQWGSFLPITLKSFGDYKAPVYAYLTVPSVAAFGLNPFAVRLPNVIIGTLAIFALYLLVKQILQLNKEFSKANIEIISFAAAFLLAVSPWHIMMSRGAFEANLITFFLPMGVYFFLKGMEKPKFLIVSVFFFGLSLFTYHSAKLISPLVMTGLIIIFRRTLGKITFKKLLPGLIIFLIFFSGFVYTFMIGGGSRAAERSIYQGALEEGATKKIELMLKGESAFKAKLLHNKYQVTAQRFITNYSQYFSVRYLFVKGAGESTYGMAPGVGVIYVFEGILLLGVIPLLFNKKFRRITFALIIWLLIAPLPSALATGVGYSGNRSEGMLPVIQILGAFGLGGWMLIMKNFDKKIIWAITTVFCLFSILSVYNFSKTYFKDAPVVMEKGMLYGNLEGANWLAQNSDGKDVIVSRGLSEPQIFIAFANKWDPEDYQSATKQWDFDKLDITWLDQMPEYSLGKYTIKSIDWEVDTLNKNTLLVGRFEELPKQITPDKIFYYPDGSAAIAIVKHD